MQLLMRLLGTAALTTAFALSSPVPNVQAQTPAPNRSSPSVNLSDQKLDQAAAAIQRVASIKQDYQQRMASAPPADRSRLANEATEAMVSAVNDEGLSVEEYDAIVDVALNDPAVKEKISQRLESKTR